MVSHRIGDTETSAKNLTLCAGDDHKIIHRDVSTISAISFFDPDPEKKLVCRLRSHTQKSVEMFSLEGWRLLLLLRSPKISASFLREASRTIILIIS